MKHTCPTCGKPMLKKTSNYHYKESGLSNVFLENVSVYECPCGVVYPSVFRVPRLHELIAERLVEKPSLLEGKEIRFLRKTLHMSSKSFSQTLGVGLTTYSKWENSRQKHSVTNDQAIRAIYIILKGIQPKEAQRILKNLAKMKLKEPKKDAVIVAEKLKEDYAVHWSLIVESQTREIPKVWVGQGGLVVRIVSQHRNFMASFGEARSGRVAPYTGLLPAPGPTSPRAFDLQQGDIK